MGFRKKKYTYGRKKKYSRRGKKYSRSKKVSGKTLLRHAKKPGIQSAAELAVKIIAKKEIAKALAPNRIFRRYYFARYNMDTNEMTWRDQVNWTGFVVAIGQIPKLDNVTQTVATSVPQQQDPSMVPSLPQYNFGTNVIGPVDSEQFRIGPKIQIKNISVSLRLHSPAVVTQRQNDGTIYNLLPFEHCFVKWAVVLTETDLQSGIAWEPTADRCVAMKKFGFSSRLDVAESQQITHQKYKTLMSGTLKVNFNQYKANEVCKEYFRTVNFPIEYQAQDLYGQQVTGRYKPFFVVRSNLPAVGNFTNFCPYIAACIKLGFQNV